MAKEEIPKKKDEIVNEDIVSEMEKSYLDYSMSVITQRALPDVRDGLKPVQRRILYAMNGMGLRSTAKTRKSAAITGEVLGKYHPHGNVAVYEAMAKQAQEFITRYPLIIGQGNFGSIDGDSPAAERYTEAKLSKYAEEILDSIDKETVRFKPNYENTLEEPEVLPSKNPNLLLNGTFGIAVGMATSIPPHNLIEVVDAAKALIDNESLTSEDLCEFVKGPDFPLGAKIYNKKHIVDAYKTGRGGVVVRGDLEVVEEKNKTIMVITSIPYRVNKAELISKIGELARDKKIEGIRDLRDESTRDIRIVIELKSTAQPSKIENYLYKYTQLESSFNYNMVALVDGVPKTLSLHEMLYEFVKFRREVTVNRLNYELRKAQERQHILFGLSKALDHIDEVVQLIKKSKATDEARANLMKKFKLSEIQANAILEMRLQKLSGLERKKINDELDEITKTIKRIESILKDKKKIDVLIKGELDDIREKYGDARRTKVITKEIGDINIEDIIAEKEGIIMITEGGYIKRTGFEEYRKQRRGGVGTKGAELKEDEFTTMAVSASTHDELFFFTDKGKVYKIKTHEIPEGKRTSKGKSIMNFLALSADENITSIIPVTKNNKKDSFLFITQNGIVKKITLDNFQNIRKTGIIALTFDKSDRLITTLLVDSKSDTLLITKKGKSIRFKASSLRAMGRTAKGVKGIKLVKDDYIVKGLVIDEDKDACVLTLTENGFGKRTETKSFKVQNRGGGGIKVAMLTDKTGDIVGAHLVVGEKDSIITMSKKGQMLNTSVSEIPKRQRQTQGVKVMNLKNNDILTSSTLV